MKKEIGGIIPAVLTPFTTDNEVDHSALRKLLAYQLELGVSAFFVCGNSGQYYLLSEEERKQVLETVLDQAGEVPVLVHVGDPDPRVAVRLARHAEEQGADAVAAILPGYSLEQSLEHYRLIGEATGLPLLAYLFAVNIEVDLELVRALTDLPTFAGVKFTSFNMYKMERIIHMNEGQYLVLSGKDEAFLGAQVMGADGAIGSTYNLMPDIFVGISEAIETGDLKKAEKLQKLANDQLELLLKTGSVRGMRYILSEMGVIGPSPRPPVASLQDQEQEICRQVASNLEKFRS